MDPLHTAARWYCQSSGLPRGTSGQHGLCLSDQKLHAFTGKKKWLDTTYFCRYWYLFWPWDNFVRKKCHCMSSWWWVPILLLGGGSSVSIIRDTSHCKIQSKASLWVFLKQKARYLECVSSDRFVRPCLWHPNWEKSAGCPEKHHSHQIHPCKEMRLYQRRREHPSWLKAMALGN